VKAEVLLCVVCLAVLATLSACEPIVPPATATPADTPTGIDGIVWQWVSVTEQTTSSTEEVPNPELYTLVLNADGTLSGRADCNTYAGTYSQEVGLEISVDEVTEEECGADSLAQEYLDLLDQVVAGGPDGAGGLALETAGGAQRVMFRDSGEADAP